MALIRLFVDLVLHAPTSLRGASHSLELLLSHLFGEQLAVPCPNTGRLWILRLGLYELTRPKEKATDWVWIVDHTIQISSVKCLLIVGCRLDQWLEDRRPIEHHDLEVLALEPVEKSSGEVVCEQLERTVEVTDVPREIVSDGGTDLQRGINLFREKHPDVARCYDITHKMALLLKKTLTSDQRWIEFLKKMAQSKKHLIHSCLAFLAPPILPDQARYMNLRGLLKWAADLRRFMDNPSANNGSLVEPWRVKLEFQWLRDFDEELVHWQNLFDIVQQTLQFIRWEGYHAGAHLEIHARLIPLSGHPQSNQLIEQIVNFVAEQSLSAKPGERFIGSSECIESLIGKGKRLEGQQSRNGFTAMILGMAAAVVKPTHEVLDAALTNVKTKQVRAWAQNALGKSVQASRRIAFRPGTTEQKQDNYLVPTTPGF